MYVIRVNVTVKPEEQANFIAQLRQEAAEMESWPGCLHFQLYEDVTAENRFLLYEEWETAAQFEAYRTSETFQQNGTKLFPMMAGKPDSAYFEAEMVGP